MCVVSGSRSLVHMTFSSGMNTALIPGRLGSDPERCHSLSGVPTVAQIRDIIHLIVCADDKPAYHRNHCQTLMKSSMVRACFTQRSTSNFRPYTLHMFVDIRGFC